MQGVCATPSRESGAPRCFDPAYESLPVEAFVPIVRGVFSEPRYPREA
jgi:hypothetical protein